MTLARWLRTHRGLAAFAAGAFLTLVALAVVGYLVLSDQRRSARVLAAALSQALAREVRIGRVTDLNTQRVVMRGVELPREGGWPARVTADRVEATGPLLAAARGEAAPIRLTVSRPVVELGPGGPAAGLAALETARTGLAGFLRGPMLLDLALTGGTAQHGGEVTVFDLTLRKGRGEARGELVARDARGAPLVVTLEGRLEGDTARLLASTRGRAAPLAAWLPAASAAALGDRDLDVRLTLDLAPGGQLLARGSLALGDVIGAEGAATVRDGLVELSLARTVADLAFAASVAQLGWQPAGRVELTDVTAAWRPEAGVRPTARATLRLASLGLPAAAVGAEVAADGVDGRVTLEPAGAGFALDGDLGASHVRVGGLDVAPARTRYRVTLDAQGGVSRADLDGLSARIEEAALQGRLHYDVAARRLEGQLGGEDVEAAGLARRLAPGWLGPRDRLRLTGLRVTLTGLDPVERRAGAARLEARGLRLGRPDGELASGPATARADLARNGATVALTLDGVTGSLPVLSGSLPRVVGSLELGRGADGALAAERATLAARDRQGTELLTADLVRAAPAGRLRLSARAPALERLGGLWPAVSRRVNGSARLDVELPGPGLEAADGRLALTVPEAELWDGKVAVRDLEADLPVRRGTAMPGEPPWGRLDVGELIAYGVVARDVTTPARVWRDRLSLNDLSYALYSGDGKGWSEIELQPAALAARGQLTGERVRVEEFIGAYGIRGGTMTGLLRYSVDYEYRAGHLGVNGRFEVPRGGTVNIELLNRLLVHAQADPTGILRQTLENLTAFEYKDAAAEVHSAADDLRVSLTLRGRERLLILPPKVREINIRNMPLSFVARQFPGLH